MAGAAVVGVIAAISGYMSYSSQKDTAKAQGKAAKLAAQQSIDAAALAEQQLREQHALDIKLAEEQKALEEEVYLESTQYVTEQIAERDAQVRAAAIAGYSASGIDPYEEDSSALSVLGRIEEESLSEQERVMKGYETFVEARTLELDQLKESTSKTFEWFSEQSKFELDYELKSRRAEASMYRSQAKYAGYGMYLGSASSGMSAGFQTHLMIQ
jgi:hypothetical protein